MAVTYGLGTIIDSLIDIDVHQVKPIFDQAGQVGITYLASVWDLHILDSNVPSNDVYPEPAVALGCIDTAGNETTGDLEALTGNSGDNQHYYPGGVL